MRTRGLSSCALFVLLAQAAQAQLAFEFTAGPGLTSLFTTDPTKAAGIMSGVTMAASKWSSLIGSTATLKYTIDYAPSLPALGASFDVYSPTPYTGVKAAMFAKATSSFDAVAVTKLQPGSSLKVWTNDLSAGPSFAPYVDMDGSVNNTIMDISRAHKKGLGLLPATDGGPGAEGTLKFGSASFDFDPTNGIDPTKYDFVGVAMHEFAHSMGFVSGVDTVTTMLPPFSGGPVGPIHATPMVTVLDLFRYSSDSVAAGPLIPDVSLPVPGFSPMRTLSFDGGATSIGAFSTGIGLAGDGKQAGHWKDDPTFGLMDPELSLGFPLTSTFETLIAGPPAPDLIALDVIGWTIVPAPGSAAALLAAGALCVGRRRRAV